MDTMVDRLGASTLGRTSTPGPTESGRSARGDVTVDDSGSEDIESELYCSTREAGCGYVGFAAFSPGYDAD
jgi:hypothetical protein